MERDKKTLTASVYDLRLCLCHKRPQNIMKYDHIKYHVPIQSLHKTKKVDWSKTEVTDLFSETIPYVLR